jgi:hypothetical protein
MEGYANKISHDQYDNIEVNTLLIETNKTIIFHVLDVILIEKKLSEKIKNILNKQFLIPKDQIIIEATHTHSSPKVSNILYPTINPEDEYIQTIIDAIIKNTSYCVEHKNDAWGFYGTCEVNDYYSNRNNIALPFNKNIYTLQFKDKLNTPIVNFINIACHPTILAPEDNKISSDLIGITRNELLKQTGIPAIIVNGECGDVSTHFTRKGRDYAEVERVGEGLAELIAKTDNYCKISLENMTISIYELNINFNEIEDNSNDERIMFKQSNPTSYIYEADGFRFITIPGELVYNLGHVLRLKDEKPMFINAYSNDFHGYAVDIEQYGHYYESKVTNYPFGKADEMISEITKLYR